MKQILPFLFALLPMIGFAGTAFRKKVVAHYSVSYQDDKTVGATDGKVRILCHFNADYLKEPHELRYGFNGTDLVAPLTAGDNELVLPMAPGNYVGQFYYDGHFDEITTDSMEVKPGKLTVIRLFFRTYRETHTVKKPVIYLYPETDQEVSVELAPAGELTFTYPAYTNGWKGTAHPDGSISIAGKTYPYLFWEGEDERITELANYHTGFVVRQDEVVAFLEEKLNEMGLSDREKTDFITFWGPIMARSEQGFAQFIFNEEVDRIAGISIQPAPVFLFRVYLLWTPLDSEMVLNPQPQVIETVERRQFYAIEWGGSELPLLHRTSGTTAINH
jgi:hypothetical protein